MRGRIIRDRKRPPVALCLGFDVGASVGAGFSGVYRVKIGEKGTVDGPSDVAFILRCSTPRLPFHFEKPRFSASDTEVSANFVVFYCNKQMM